MLVSPERGAPHDALHDPDTAMTHLLRLRVSLLLVLFVSACAAGDLPSEDENNATTNNAMNNTPTGPNTRPLAAPIASQMVPVGQMVLLDGAASSDADGDPLTYTWTLSLKPAASAAALEDTDKSIARITPDVAGDYIITLVVSDGKVSSAATSAKLTALPAQVNRAPVANAGVARQVATKEPVMLDGQGSSDPDGDTLTYAWTLETRPAGSTATLNSATSPTPSFTPDIQGRYEAQLIVRDGKLNSTPSKVVITAIEPTANNRAPVAKVGADLMVDVGQSAQLSSQGSSDPDGDTLSFTWTLSTRPNGSSAFLSANDVPSPVLIPDVAGTYKVSLVISDGELSSAPLTTTITARALNQAPVADAGLSRSVVTGEMIALDGRASSDPDNNPLTYKWTMTSKPAGSSAALSSSTNAQPSFTPDRDGAYAISLVVNDGKLDSPAAAITITAGTPCLIISEYLEGSSNNKALEIFNCGSSPIDLSSYALCLVTNAATTCTANFGLQGVLGAGAVYVHCNSQISDNSKCGNKNVNGTFQGSGIAGFNGDDRLMIFRDKDANGSFSAGDQIVDQFGDLASQPTADTWKDMTLRRNVCTPYTGGGSFASADYYITAPADSFDNLGVAPTCP
jgi:hypothetical protein